MLKIKNFLIILAGVILFSFTSEARVCFLAGSDDDSGCLTAVYDIESTKCSGFTLCESPKKGVSVCIDAGNNYYKPEDCCSNAEFYEPCNGEGSVCEGSVCTSIDENGEDVKWCERGQCKCDSSYSEICDPTKGLEGIGDPCDGKYQSCRCNSSYYQCSSAATGSGSSCSDDTGTLYSVCTCPDAGENGWVTDPDECCGGYSDVCINQPGGQAVYKCRTMSLPECVCGYNFSSDKQACVNGCTDSLYNYKGETPVNATCKDTVPGLQEGIICGNDCQCNDGYWDFVETCLQQDDSICEQLGYVDSSCDGDWVACPYDVSAKKCLNIKKDTANTCPDGYTEGMTDVSGCGSSGAQGWRLDVITINETLQCGKCIAKDCEDGSTSGGFCLAPSIKVTTGYSGDKLCTKCADCTDGYAVNSRYCGAGYILGTEKDANGCYKCILQTCPEGSSTSPNCIGNTFPVSNGSYIGSDACYECQTCSSGYVTDITFCGFRGAAAWHLSSTDKDSIGCKKCVANDCPSGSAVNKTCLTGQDKVIAGYSGTSTCYKCEGDATQITPGPDQSTCEGCRASGMNYLCGGKCSSTGGSSCVSCIVVNPGGITPANP